MAEGPRDVLVSTNSATSNLKNIERSRTRKRHIQTDRQMDGQTAALIYAHATVGRGIPITCYWKEGEPSKSGSLLERQQSCA